MPLIVCLNLKHILTIESYRFKMLNPLSFKHSNLPVLIFYHFILTVLPFALPILRQNNDKLMYVFWVAVRGVILERVEIPILRNF